MVHTLWTVNLNNILSHQHTSVLFSTNVVAFLLNFDLNLGNDFEYNLGYDMLAHYFFAKCTANKFEWFKSINTS